MKEMYLPLCLLASSKTVIVSSIIDNFLYTGHAHGGTFPATMLRPLLAPPTCIPMVIIFELVSTEANVLSQERSCLSSDRPGSGAAHLYELSRVSPFQPQDMGQHSQTGPGDYPTAGW